MVSVSVTTSASSLARARTRGRRRVRSHCERTAERSDRRALAAPSASGPRGASVGGHLRARARALGVGRRRRRRGPTRVRGLWCGSANSRAEDGREPHRDTRATAGRGHGSRRRIFPSENAIVRPAAVEPVPILVGGRSDAAVRRAGRHGDGWFGIWVSPSRYANAIEQMQAAASEVGRDHVSWHNTLNVWCGVGSQGDDTRHYVASAMENFYGIPYERFEKWSPAGSPEHIAKFLAPYVEAGCHTFNVIACGESVEARRSARWVRFANACADSGQSARRT